MSRNCCSCVNDAASSCKTQITMADLAELLYVKGLDANLCTKYAAIADFFQFRDCAGNIVASNSQIVVCSEFATKLCDTLEELASGGSVTLGVTEVLGSDCQVYTIPETVLVANDSTSIDFTQSGDFGHAVTAVVRISVSSDNQVTILGDGLYVAQGAGVEITAIDNDCIDTTVTETATGVFTVEAELLLDPASPLSCGEDGLTIPIGANVTINGIDGDCIDVTISEGPVGTFDITADVNISATSGNIITCESDGIFAAATNVTIGVTDTPCINMSVTESPANTFNISAIPTISGTSGNQVTCTVSGLFVPRGAGVIINALDTDCIDTTVTQSPTGTFTISSSPIIDPSESNLLQCTEDGLFVSAGAVEGFGVVAVDTDCLDVTVNESPPGIFNVSVDPILSATIGNQISCEADGLYIPLGAGTVITGVDTTCMFAAVDEITPGTFEVSVAPKIADAYTGYPAGCNGLVCIADGLAVPPDVDGIGDTPSTLDTDALVYNGTLVNASTFTGNLIHIDLVNPSICRSAVICINLAWPEISVLAVDGNPYTYKAEMLRDINIPPFIATGFVVQQTERVNGTQLQTRTYGSQTLCYTVPPGFVGYMEHQFRITMEIGEIPTLVVNRIVDSYSIVTI